MSETEAAAKAPETEAKAPAEPKELSRTQKFQIDLQELYSKEFEKKVSRQFAWDVFKKTISLCVDSVIRDGRLPLQGVGTFEIIQAGARKSKLITHHHVPKFRFRPGAKINQFLEKTLPGVLKSQAEQDAYLKEHPEAREFLKEDKEEESGDE